MDTSAREHPQQYVDVLGKRMAYVEMGTGDPIVFQHGNPTSSYLWRNIMPALADQGRCIAVDLIGMGGSDKLEASGPGRYRFDEHARYLYACWEALGIRENVTFVVHDWGSALAFNWARLHPGSVKGIAFMEAIVAPYASMAEWRATVEAHGQGDDFDPNAPGIFSMLRSAEGERFVLEDNGFVEQLLPAFTLRALGEAEMAVYRRPFARAGEDRRPTLTWPREMPIGGEPADVVATVQACAEYLAATPTPKLFIRCNPGALIRGRHLELVRGFPNQEEVEVAGLHFAQEDCPEAIAGTLADWHRRL